MKIALWKLGILTLLWPSVPPEQIEEQIEDIPVPLIVEETVNLVKLFYLMSIFYLRWSTSRLRLQ